MNNDEFEFIRKTCMAYETKLIELMGEDAFHAFATELARDFFAEEICAMPESDFKETILDNFDAITGSDEDYQKLMGNIQNDRDCEHCAHYVKAGIDWYCCESWKCEFKPKGDRT